MSPIKGTVPEPEPVPEPAPAPAPQLEEPAPRGDPWVEPCPKCGLLGCVAGHT